MADRWRIRGVEYGNCNCAWGCPCQFNAPTTHGFCEAVTGGVIEEGHFEDVRLDGLHWVLLLQWRKIAPAAAESKEITMSEREKALGGNPFAGFLLVLRNKYLLGIALFIAGISAINTFLYFEQLELVEEKFEALAARTQVFASLDAIVQLLVMLTQLTLTGFIATRIGVIALLVAVPFIMVFGLTVYAAFVSRRAKRISGGRSAR